MINVHVSERAGEQSSTSLDTPHTLAMACMSAARTMLE
jgi:hypothetical protein